MCQPKQGEEEAEGIPKTAATKQTTTAINDHNNKQQPSTMQIAGHGNFGSLDDDPPAAMRYTECRLAGAAPALLLDDLEADTVRQMLLLMMMLMMMLMLLMHRTAFCGAFWPGCRSNPPLSSTHN